MNIYFACSITGGRQFETAYQAIVSAILADGHEISTAHLADPSVKALESIVSPREVFERDVAWIRACDALVAEVSTPSHGVGYEMAFALSLGKPVLCCYQAGQPVSKMIAGNTSQDIRVHAYQTIEDALAAIRVFLEQVNNDL